MPSSNKQIYTVSHLTSEVRRLLEASYPEILVEGEISGLSRPASGHQYFNIKDENAQISCAFFKNAARISPTRLADGMQVLITAKISLYERRGDFQLIVQSVVEAGEGLLRKKFERLKQRLELEGLFNSTHKKPLPVHPKQVGVITSTTGAALHDILTTFRRRFPSISILIYPSLVQGEQAANSLVDAIATANIHNQCDVLIVARGGGSLEDLWPFNEEVVARAIYNSRIPVVSAVGHETDISISDLVADVRAATPTAAAEMLSPDRKQLIESVNAHENRLYRLMRRKIDESGQRLDLNDTKILRYRHHFEQRKFRFGIIEEKFTRLSSSMISERLHRLGSLKTRIQTPGKILERQQRTCQELHYRMEKALTRKLSSEAFSYKILLQRFTYQKPAARILQKQQHISVINNRLSKGLQGVLLHKRHSLEKKVHALNTLSPLTTLTRGFSAIQNERGEIVSSVKQVNINEIINARLKDGSLLCKVMKINRKNNDL